MTVALRRTWAKDLGQVTGCEAAEDIHLPQSVLGSDVALQEDCILPGGCFNVRNATRIPSYIGRGVDRSRNLSRRFR